MPQFIRFNLYPLETHVYDKDGHPLQVNQNTRTVVTDDEVYVYVDDHSGPSIWFTDRLEDFSGDATNGWTVETSDYTVKMKRSGGCGCGSRLKGYNPFPGLPFERMFP